MRLFVAALVVIGLVIAVAWGVQAAFVYGFLAAVAAGITYAAAVGGEWVEGVSRRRFDDRGRR